MYARLRQVCSIEHQEWHHVDPDMSLHRQGKGTATHRLKIISERPNLRKTSVRMTHDSLRVTPWTKNHEGRGPAWSNSMFDDNAEFGLGFRLAADKHLHLARMLLTQRAPIVGSELATAILDGAQIQEIELCAQRIRVAKLKLEEAAAKGLELNIWI